MRAMAFLSECGVQNVQPVRYRCKLCFAQVPAMCSQMVSSARQRGTHNAISDRKKPLAVTWPGAEFNSDERMFVCGHYHPRRHSARPTGDGPRTAITAAIVRRRKRAWGCRLLAGRASSSGMGGPRREVLFAAVRFVRREISRLDGGG